jgi:hypothetical protein
MGFWETVAATAVGASVPVLPILGLQARQAWQMRQWRKTPAGQGYGQLEDLISETFAELRDFRKPKRKEDADAD